MSRWINRLHPEPASAPAVPSGGQPWLQTPLTPGTVARLKDRNAPDYRYQVNQKCIYERRLPGGSYITAHVQRVQSGYYDSPVIHGGVIENVRFVAINFVFHPSRSTFRFKSAEIKIAIHHTREGDKKTMKIFSEIPPARQVSHGHGTQTGAMSNALVRSTDVLPRARIIPSPPRFLRHAPHLLYGSISPETLDWNFNLAGSLGVSQGPGTVSIQPSYGMKSSYKIYEMMKIQGSVRTLRSWYGRKYDIEDGEMVWTLEENQLQKSGLPREFTFVMLLTKGSGGSEDYGDVKLEVDVDPKVAGRLGGGYPGVAKNWHHYRPFKNGILDLDEEIGQVFEPQIKGRGFNFANIASSFDDFVFLPGTTFSTSEPGAPQSPTEGSAQPQAPNPPPPKAAAPQPLLPSGDTTLNVRVVLESSRESPVPSSLQLQQVPYLNLKPPSRNPSWTASRLPPSNSGSQNSPRRTITISSAKSLRKHRSRSELSREYTQSPTEPKVQTHRDSEPAVQQWQRNRVTPHRSFSYEEYDHDSQMSPMHGTESNLQYKSLRQSSPAYATPPSRHSHPTAESVRSEDTHDEHDVLANGGEGLFDSVLNTTLSRTDQPRLQNGVASSGNDILNYMSQRTSSLHVPNPRLSPLGWAPKSVRYSFPIGATPLSDEIET